MRQIRLIALTIILLLLQSVVFSRLTLFGSTTDLPLIFVILVGILAGKREGFIYGALAGFLADIASGTAYFSLFILPLFGFMSGFMKEAVVSEDSAVLYAVIFAFSFLSVFLRGWLLNNYMGADLTGLVPVSLVSAAMNAIVSPALKRAADKVYSA